MAHGARSFTNPGMTPLMAAVTGGKHKVIKALLKAAPTATDIANAEGYSVMHAAVSANPNLAHWPTSPLAHWPTSPLLSSTIAYR